MGSVVCRSVAEEVLLGLGIEEVHDLPLEGDVQRSAVDHAVALLGGQTDGGNTDDETGLILGVDVQMELGTLLSMINPGLSILLQMALFHSF